MAAVTSNMIELGTKAPSFTLPNTTDQGTVSLENISLDKGLVVMFICNHCPFVKHLLAQVVDVANHYQSKGINFIAISSNDVDNYPDDSPEKMTETAQEYGITFPYLYDESQATAKAYEAACTPDFYVFDQNKSLVYRGQFDDSRPGNGRTIDGEDLRHALDCLVDGAENDKPQKPSIGCSIKWK